MIYDVTNKLVIDKRTRDWCKFSYPSHPHGCPNYNKRDICPPAAPLVHEVFDLSQQHWFIVIEYDLSAHVIKIKKSHPDWSDKQCRCCFYWQNTVRKQLREMILNFIKEKIFLSNFSDIEERSWNYTLIPEAMGINVFRTCHKIGIKIRKNPIDIVYKIALIGRLHKKN